MGMRFDLKSANWVAYLLHPSSPAPSFGEDWAEKETLRLFLQRLSDQFYSSDNRERELLRKARLAERMIEELGATDQRQRVADILKDIKIFFGDHPWIALIIPSGFDQEADNYLCDASFLRSLLRLFSAGLILQPEALNEEDANHFSLLDVFPAFRTALAESTNWPGILIWTPGGDSVFLPFGTTNVNQLSERASWIFSHLDAIGADLELIKQRYAKEFPDSFESWKHTIHFVQLSDLHIGSREAALRLARVEQLIRDVVNDLGPSAKVVPVVSGDVMDTPDERRLWEAKRFLGFLSQIGTEEPVVVLGNHDVRGNGFLSDKFREALRIPTKRVAWYRDLEIGLVCFDSVRGGRLARGYIGEEQLLDIGNEIDRERNHKNFSLLGMLHHHPVPVEVPDWYVKPFYERALIIVSATAYLQATLRPVFERFSAGRAGTSRRSTSHPNKSLGLAPKNRSAAVVSSLRVR